MRGKACFVLLAAAAAAAAACAGGSSWVAERSVPGNAGRGPESVAIPSETRSGRPDYRVRSFGGEAPTPVERAQSTSMGRVLGTFRNTYYDFPAESDFEGAPSPLHDPSCNIIGQVARGFFEAVCVQGSGVLARGGTVSFAKRDCPCAEVCPKTAQKICFDLLDREAFPWGRGATGRAITPLLTVAVDTSVIALGTALYVPEYDGMPRDPTGSALHDGCFVAQDRGLRVVGRHIDVFAGDSAITRLWNQRVPSNQGVTVVLDSPRCERLGG